MTLGATLGILSAEKSIPPSPTPGEGEDLPLPETYGTNRLVLLPIDPYWVHAYWELAAPGASETLAGGDVHPILRMYNVTSIYFDSANAHSLFDIQVSVEARNWYINLWSPGRSLCAELGLVRPDGSFTPLVRSNIIQTPPACSSTTAGERWVRVEWKQEDAFPGLDHSADGGSASRWRDALRAKEHRPIFRGTRRVMILRPDESPPPGPARHLADDAGSPFDPGLSSSHLVKTPGNID